MKKTILILSIILTVSCEKKCEFKMSSEYESGSYCYSTDGTYYENYEYYMTYYEYDFENWEMIERIETNYINRSGDDLEMSKDEIIDECNFAGAEITSGSCY